MRLANESRTLRTGLTWYNVLTELFREKYFVRLVTNPQRHLNAPWRIPVEKAEKSPMATADRALVLHVDRFPIGFRCTNTSIAERFPFLTTQIPFHALTHT